MKNTIPLVDLKAQYKTIVPEINTAIQQILKNSAFILGSPVSIFEDAFAQFCNVKYAIGIASGTGALHLALRALGVGIGDEVITVPHTFFATAEAIIHTGATPIFIDVEDQYFNIDPSKLEAAVTEKTKAIVPVHLYGQCADMESILEISKRYNIPVVEDAAQAHGAKYNGVSAGGFGNATCFSFYPGKNLGAYGDAGAVVTNNEDLATKIRMLRNHGRTEKYVHKIIGYGERIDALQAAILNVKLTHLKEWTKKRVNVAHRYSKLLREVNQIITPPVRPNSEHVFHLYVIKCQQRDTLLKHFNQNNIQAGIHYPIPLHLQPALKYLGYKPGDFPVSEELSSSIISLPIYPELSEVDVNRIVHAVKDFYC